MIRDPLNRFVPTPRAWYALAVALWLTATATHAAPPQAEPELTPSNSLPGVVHFELASKSTGRTYRIGVGLPAGFSPSSDERYPVVVLTDAEGKLHGSTEVARGLARTRQAPAVILVGVWNPTRTSRRDDLTPSQISSPVTAAAAGETYDTPVGGAKRFHTFLRTELLPTIDEMFPTDPSTRVYFGHSLGGLFGLYALQQPNDPFTHYLISSPSIWWNDREILRNAVPQEKSPRTVYLSVGEFEQIPPNLDEDILALFPDEVRATDRAARMVEGALEVFDYLKTRPNVEVYGHIEESAPHISADTPAFERGIRVLLPGVNQGELRRRSSTRPRLPWE